MVSKQTEEERKSKTMNPNAEESETDHMVALQLKAEVRRLALEVQKLKESLPTTTRIVAREELRAGAEGIITSIGNQARALEKFKDNIYTEIQELTKNLFSNKEFLARLHHHIERVVNNTVKVALSREKVRDYINAKIQERLKDDFKTTITLMVESILKRLNNQLDRQLHHTRATLYSIDAEIRHFTQTTGTTEATDNLVRKAIQKFAKEEQRKIGMNDQAVTERV